MTTDQPARYRRTPAEIEAVQWTGTNADALRAFAGGYFDIIDPEDRIEDPDQDAQLLVEASHWVGIKPTDWVVKYEGYFVAKADATFRAVWEPAAVPVPPPAGTDLRAQLLDALDFAYCQGLGFDTPEALLAAYERAVRVPPPADQTALRQHIRRAICEAEGFGWDTDMLEPDEYGEVADAVMAVLPEQTDRGAAGLPAIRPQTLTALASHIDARAVAILRPDSQTYAEWQTMAALLRRVAAEEQPAETWDTPDARPGTTDHTLTNRQQSADTKAAAAPGHIVIGEIACAMSNPAHSGPCIPWGHSGPGVAPAVGEQPETQEARVECAHCWREIENRGTPSMGGNHHVKWVHVPGGFTVCFPQRGGDSPRAEPRTPE